VFKNNVVACLPFTEEQLKPQKVSRLATVGPRGSSLLELFVWHGNELLDNLYIGSDDVVFVKSECLGKPWAKEKFTIDGVVWQDVVDPKTGEHEKIEFILVPITEIVAIDRDAMEGCGCECNHGQEEKPEPPKVN
jgi:hypothetical protein